MPHYKVEVWISNPEDGVEDMLEARVTDLCNANGMRVQGGPVVFRMFGPAEL